MSTGPLGGDLENPNTNPERRRSPFNGDMLDGLPTLHKFIRPDTATPGHKNELPWHRMAAYMLLAGRTNSEIALAAGVAPATVSHLRANRWFQELLAVLANETGQDITGVLQSEAQASVQTLVSLRDNAESERVQLAAALALLEHANGKPVQKILSHTSHSTLPPAEEYEATLKELEALRSRRSSTVLPQEAETQPS